MAQRTLLQLWTRLRPPNKRWVGVLAALLFSGLALLMSLAFYPLASNSPALLFLVAVGLSGWYGGLTPALLSTVFGLTALDYYFETPPLTFYVTESRTGLDLVAFLLLSLVLGTVNSRLRAARDRAEAAVRARDELLATVSHDLRTPLTAITTAISTLRDPSATLPDQVRTQLMTTIEAEADRLSHFVTNALTLSRLESGIVPTREWTAVGEVASAVLDRCAPLLAERPVDFSVPDTLPLIQCDAVLLGQALTNLVENAAFHTPPGTPVRLRGYVGGGSLTLEVSDQGRGIPPDQRRAIFNKYERLNHQARGAGLGLAIARAAIQAQGGRLWVTDAAGGGACFVIQLPRGATTPVESHEAVRQLA